MMTFDEFRKLWRDRVRDDREAVIVLERSRDQRRGWIPWDETAVSVPIRRGWAEWPAE